MGGDNTSVLIKGMEMPKNCKECMLAYMDDVDFDYVLYCKATKKYADLDMYDHPMGWNCLLIEVPTPHGRLIDADAIQDYNVETFGQRLLIIDTAPTVIEAED